jgi:hypothetical protein
MDSYYPELFDVQQKLSPDGIHAPWGQETSLEAALQAETTCTCAVNRQVRRCSAALS